MLELAREVLSGEEAWLVGGAVRDELLGRRARRPRHRRARATSGRARWRSGSAARRSRSRSGTAPGGSRSTAGARSTSRRCPARSRTTSPSATSRSTRSRGRSRAASRSIRSAASATSRRDGMRAVGESVFGDDPLRLLRAVRLEDELELPARRGDGGARPARRGARDAAGGRADRRRAAAALAGRLPAARRARPARAARRHGSTTGSTAGTRPTSAWSRSSATELRRFPVSNELRRFAAALLRAGPPEPTARAIHRFRRPSSRGRSRRSRSPARRSSRRRSRRPARPSRPSRCCAATSSTCRRARDRPPARRDRGGAGRRYDRHQGGGAGLCTTPRGAVREDG